MRIFPIILATAFAASALAALPAAAQDYAGLGAWSARGAPSRYAPPRDIGAERLQARYERLGEWIGRSERARRINHRRARILFDQLTAIRGDDHALRMRQAGRLYPDQERRLEAGLDRIEDRLRDAHGRRHASDY
jgi:hypothetical protein